MKEAGLKCLSAAIPFHSTTLLITTDGKVMLQDMQLPSINRDLDDSLINGVKRDGSPVKVKDIAEFGEDSSSVSMTIEFDSSIYDSTNSRLQEGNNFMIISDFDKGLQSLVLAAVGLSLNDLKMYPEAVTAYRKALEILPTDPQLYDNLGVSLVGLGRREEAVLAYKKALSIEPWANACTNLAISLEKLGLKAQAVETFMKAIEMNPKDHRPYFELGGLLRRNDFHSEAVEMYVAAMRIDPSHPNTYVGMGDSLRHLGKIPEAINAYERFILIADRTKDEKAIKRARVLVDALKKNPQVAASL
jgi:tetratricopeptide (TPR) repeat protein